MAGLEIVGPVPPGVLAEGIPPPRHAAADTPSDQPARAVEPIQAMWNNADGSGLKRPEPRAPIVPLKPPKPRSLWVALPSMILLTGLAAFFSWVSAEPFWLSVGHDISGTVTVSECVAEGFAPRCEGDFVSDSGGQTLPGVRITGDTEAERQGTTVAAQAVSGSARSVYIGDTTGLVLRWGIGLFLVLCCGLAIAAVSGAWQWRGKARAGAVLACVAGPLLLWFGALALTW